METTNNNLLAHFDNFKAHFELLLIMFECQKEGQKEYTNKYIANFMYKSVPLLPLKYNNYNSEIKDLIFQNGKGSERVVNYIHSECEKIRKGFAAIESSNNILKPTFDLSDEDLQKYFDSLKSNDKEFYRAYQMATATFYNFNKSIVDISVSEETQQNETIKTPELETIVNKYVLLDQLGIIQFLKDKHQFDNMKQTDKIALLSMILGLDKKGGHSIKGILSSPQSTDKNYPLKEKNLKTVWGELTRLGITKPNPVKSLQKR